MKYKIINWNKNDWCNFLIGFLMGVISSGLSAFLIFVVKYVTDSEFNMLNKWMSILFMIAIGIGSIIFAFVSKVYLAKLSAYKMAQIRKTMFDNIQDLSPHDLKDYSYNSLMTRLSLDVYSFTVYYNWLLINVIPSFIRWLIFSIMTIIVSWLIFLFMILLSFILFVVAILFSRKSTLYYEKSITNIDNINKIIEENIISSRVVRSFNLFERQIYRFSKINMQIYENSTKAEIKTFISFPFAIAFVNGAAILIVLLGSIINWSSASFLGGRIDTGDMLAVFSYAYLILWSVYDATFLYIFYKRSYVSRKRIHELMNLKSNTICYEGKEFKNGDIEFKNVSFKYYESSNEYVLKNISFKIKANSSFGIIGQTGSGKTTILNLLTGIWKPTEGEILINGININELNSKSLLDHISYAFQDKKLLFSGSIKDNIKFSNENISDEELKEVIKLSELEQFVNSLKEGVDYKLEEFGQNLSGGQKQRVNIARAFAKKASIYLFDDVTSALDNITEQNIIKNIDNHFQDSIKIITSQKISSIQNLDQIIVLNEGVISSIGKHEELIEKDEIYKQIWTIQNKEKEDKNE